MTINLDQFVASFLEEAYEGLDTMEAGLLALSEQGTSAETINEIFRAAHSIKGGAGTFGFTAVSEFTHGAETLLDAMRHGHHPIDTHSINLLLEASDCIRALLDTKSSGVTLADARIADVRARLDAAAAQPETLDSTPHSRGWLIKYSPEVGVLQTGNDPLPLFSALAELGEIEVRVDWSKLPTLDELDSTGCYLSWEIQLYAPVPRETLVELFEWVADQCELLDFEPLDANEAAQAAAQTALESSAQRDLAATPPLTAPATTHGSNDSNAGTDSRSSGNNSLRVNTSKIDQLINMVGELVITQSMLKQVGNELESSPLAASKLTERLQDGLSQLERHTRELQESVMGIRMVPISFTFNRFPRLVHDVSGKLGKRIDLQIRGEQTEIDKTLIERLGDPLVHLIRNAVDHGIERPEERSALGKAPVGTVILEAGHKGGNVVIEIHDDGKGLDPEKILAKAIERGLCTADANLSEAQILSFIFEPGFSMAASVSDLSGRGVGMDVVRSNVQALSGTIEVESRVNIGTSFRITLPLTLAILDGQGIRVGQDLYVIPLVSILESVQLNDAHIRRPAEVIELFRWRDEHLPLIRLDQLLGTEPMPISGRNLVVVVEGGGLRAGLAVSDLLAQQQVVIKSLADNFIKVEGFSGATILGDGSVALILDVAGIIRLASRTPARMPRRNTSSLERNHAGQ